MKEQVLNEIVKFDSTAEYYQQLETSILGNQSCYEATVVDGELLGMKVLVEGKHPVGLYLPNATDERRQKAEQMILDYVADPDYFERYMSIGPTANDHFVFMEKSRGTNYFILLLAFMRCSWLRICLRMRRFSGVTSSSSS